MRLPSTIVVLATGVLCATAAQAQFDDAPTGSHLKGDRTEDTVAVPDGAPDPIVSARTSARARSAVYGAAECMAETHQGAIRAVLGGAKPTSEFNKAMSYCLGSHTFDMGRSSIEGSEELWNGALAEAYLRASRDGPPPPVASARADYAAAWMSQEPNARIVDQMAACMAEMHPEAIQALVRTSPGSVQENTATAQASPYIGPCLVRGATLKTNAAGLRAAFALALFHRENDGETGVVSAEGRK